MNCRLCGNGPCLAGGEDNCPWPKFDPPQDKRSTTPDPRPTKAAKKGRKT